MSSVKISGYGDDLTVNGTRIGDLTPAQHEKIEHEEVGQNYSPLGEVGVSIVKDSSTLIARQPDPNDINPKNESAIFDVLCCYPAVSQGLVTKPTVVSVFQHLQND